MSITRLTIAVVSLIISVQYAYCESVVVRVGERTDVVSAPKFGVDLGVIDQHRKIDCSFSVTNNHWRERRLVGAKGNCACLKIAVEPGLLKRGESRKVNVEFDPAGMVGPVDKMVMVNLDGKTVEYPIKANVRLRLGLLPSEANFGVVEAGRCPDPIVCSLSGYVVEGTKVELVPPQNPYFNVRLETNAVVAAFKCSQTSPGYFTEMWKLRTSDPEIPEIMLPVSARVAGGLSLSTRKILLSCEEGICSRQVMLRPSTGKDGKRLPLKVLGAETGPRHWGDISIVERPLGGWMIRIDGINPDAVRQFSRKPYLEIKTDFPGMENFRIPVMTEQKK